MKFVKNYGTLNKESEIVLIKTIDIQNKLKINNLAKEIIGIELENFTESSDEVKYLTEIDKYNWFNYNIDEFTTPNIDIDESGEISFINGRNRFTWLLKEGVSEIPMEMEKKDLYILDSLNIDYTIIKPGESVDNIINIKSLEQKKFHENNGIGLIEKLERRLKRKILRIEELSNKINEGNENIDKINRFKDKIIDLKEDIKELKVEIKTKVNNLLFTEESKIENKKFEDKMNIVKYILKQNFKEVIEENINDGDSDIQYFTDLKSIFYHKNLMLNENVIDSTKNILKDEKIFKLAMEELHLLLNNHLLKLTKEIKDDKENDFEISKITQNKIELKEDLIQQLVMNSSGKIDSNYFDISIYDCNNESHKEFIIKKLNSMNSEELETLITDTSFLEEIMDADILTDVLSNLNYNQFNDFMDSVVKSGEKPYFIKYIESLNIKDNQKLDVYINTHLSKPENNNVLQLILQKDPDNQKIADMISRNTEKDPEEKPSIGFMGLQSFKIATQETEQEADSLEEVKIPFIEEQRIEIDSNVVDNEPVENNQPIEVVEAIKKEEMKSIDILNLNEKINEIKENINGNSKLEKKFEQALSVLRNVKDLLEDSSKFKDDDKLENAKNKLQAPTERLLKTVDKIMEKELKLEKDKNKTTGMRFN